MTPLTIYYLIAFTGAALLGFLCAWYWQRHRIETLTADHKILQEKSKETQALAEQLQAESDNQKLSIENLQRLLQSLENQNFSLEQDLKRARAEVDFAKIEKHRLMAELQIQLRENEAIREMPKLDLDVDGEDEEGDLDIRTKAKKLVRAFKKGFGNPTAAPADPNENNAA